MATFSVIVPVYNGAKTVERCVGSIIASGGGDVQVILIEDCSKDDSLAVCRRLEEKYPNVLCLHNERNRGVSHTRNRGLAAADGKYLLFVDCDDWVDGNYVPAFRRAVDAGNSFAVCGYVNHDEKHNGRTDAYAWENAGDMQTLDLREQIEDLYHRTLLQQLWNKMFRTDVVRACGIRFDESISIGEDTRFILDYIRLSGVREFTRIDSPLYHYMRDQDGSLMYRVGYESVEEPLKNLRKLYEILGLSGEELETRLVSDRQKQIESYAYLIMHNAGMTLREKKRLILALDKQQGPALYRSNRLLYIKERIAQLLR